MSEHRNKPAGGGRRRSDKHQGSRPVARDITHAEAFYFLKQKERQTRLVFRLRDGEELCGMLSWHDRASYRLELVEGGHRVIQRQAVAYVYKDGKD